jgi:predicted transposase/invertase (TIGR01784 family)
MPNQISTHITHDAFLKNILSNRGAAIAFMQTFLPEEIKENQDIGSYQVVDTSFISGKIKSRFADVLFKVPVKDSKEWIIVSVLVELKSNPDKLVSFQILEYLALAYRKQLKEKKQVHLVLPIIYYHGKQHWKYKPVGEFISQYPKVFTPYIPAIKSCFIDLKDKTETEIQDIKDDLLRTALYVQYLRFIRSIDSAVLVRVFSRIPRDLDGNFLNTILVYALKKTDINPEVFSSLLEEFPEDIKSETMTIAEHLIQEGKLKGIEQITIEVVLRSHNNGIDVRMIANITGLPEEKVKEIIANQK